HRVSSSTTGRNSGGARFGCGVHRAEDRILHYTSPRLGRTADAARCMKERTSVDGRTFAPLRQPGARHLLAQ
ncbi:MAG TPA: hypothetical protein VFU02_22185, partial [Polyangiaceae bacterium]|nr:hypothetical protein [Polyangiaceae bacterium]